MTKRAPSRLNQADYKKAARDIQRNFDDIYQLLFPVVEPLSSNANKISLQIDNNTLAVDGDGRLYVNVSSITPAAGSSIPVLNTAPPAVAGQVNPWVYVDGGGNIDYAHIRLVYPDGTDHGKQITLEDINFTP